MQFTRIGMPTLVVLAVSSRMVNAQPVSDTSQRDFDRGVEFHRAGDLKRAQAAYEAALKAAPQRVDVLSNLGLVYGQSGRYELAIRMFQRALAVDPTQAAVRFNLGLTYLEAQRFDDARREFARILRDDPAELAARHMLGLALLKLERTNEGAAELATVFQRRPGDVELACTLASAYIKAHQLAEASTLVDNLLKESRRADAQFISGSYFLAAQKYPEALEHLKRAYELNANLPDLGTALADAYAYNGNPDLATQMFAEQLRRNPMDYTANLLLGWLYLQAMNQDEAAKYLERARKIRPDDPHLLFQLARLARSRGNQQQAAELLERVVAQRPGDGPAHVLLAQTYVKLKRSADAAREQAIVERLNAEEQARQPAPRDR